MKTYIFIIRRICNITGAQQYVYNKTHYLKKQGWRVLVFSSLKGPILIDEFKEYKNYIFPALYLSPYYYRKGDVKSIIDNIVNIIGDCNGDECIVESDSLLRAVWGELIASRIKCRHLSLLVQENHKLDKDGKQFLMFKYNRHELAGISKTSLNLIFNGTVKDRDDTRFRAYCNNVIGDCNDNYSELLNIDADYTLGSLGRLGKACVPAIVDGICSYIKHHLNKQFNIVFIGGPITHRTVMPIRKQLEKCPNAKLIFTGDIYPIPVSFIKKFDVFVSTAGSAIATYRVGCPTIKVNPINGDPVGVIGLGEEMKGKTMYDSRSDISIEDCIDKAIKKRSEIVYIGEIDEDYYTKMHEEFQRQLSFGENVFSKEYYDEDFLMSLKAHSQYPDILLWLLGHISGRFLTYVMKIMKF